MKRSPRGKKISQGVYEYIQGDRAYSEEEFQVYEGQDNRSLIFFSTMFGRAATGEMLKFQVDYTVSKDYRPQKVFIEKELGEHQTTEIYRYNKTKNLVHYLFVTGRKEKRCEIPVTSGFHISTPTTAGSMLFLKGREEKSGDPESYTLIGNENKWHFANPPKTSSVLIDYTRIETRNMKIGDKTVNTLVYNLYENIKGKNFITPKTPSVEISMGQDNIPYMIRAEDKLCVKIKKLENFL